MGRFKAFIRNKWTIIGIVVILIAAAVTTTFLLVQSDDYMTVRALGGNDIEQHRARDFRHSRLFLHSNGTFAVEIILSQANADDMAILAGIGTWERAGNVFTFTYIRMYRLVGEVFQVDLVNSGATFEFTRTRGRIGFHCPNHRYYFFR